MNVKEVYKHDEEVRLKVEASAEEIDKSFVDGLEFFLVQYDLSSAEGTTPLEKIRNEFGDDTDKAVYSAIINYLIPFAMGEYGTLPVATFDVDYDTPPVQGSPFTFEMTALIAPSFELTSYERVSVSLEPMPEVKEQDIDEQMAMFARQITAEQQNVDPNSPDLVVPEITEQWVQDNLTQMNITSVEELRDRFRQTSEEELEARYEQAKLAAAMEEYRKRFPVTLPENMVSIMTDELFETFQMEIAQQGMTFDDIATQQGFTEEQVKATLHDEAEIQLMHGFILDSIFKHEQLELTPRDLQQVLRNAAPGREEDYFESMKNSGRVDLLKQSAARMKAASWVVEHTTYNTL